MKNEKIFNAMEHLEDRFIAEAMVQYGSDEDIDLQGEEPVDPYFEDIDLQGEEPVDPYSEGIVFDLGSVKEKNKSGFVKWAGLAAGICAVAAGAVIIKSSGLLNGSISMPHGTLLDNTQIYHTTMTHDESVKIYGFNKLKEDFDLEETDITDSDLITQMQSGTAAADGNKLYFVKKSEDEKKFAVCVYDIKENTCETVSQINNGTNCDRWDITVLCVYGGSIYFKNSGYNYFNDIHICEYYTHIFKYDIDAKTFQVIFAIPATTTPTGGGAVTDRTGEQFLGAIKAAEGYLFFENGVYINADYDISTNISRYDMESGETVIFKENAQLFGVQGDKLLFTRSGENADVWELICCDVKSGENEETLWVFPNEIDYGNVCFDGKDIWVANHFKRNYEEDDQGRFGYEIRRLNESKEFDTIVKVYDMSARNIKSVQDLIVSERMIFDPISEKCIVTGRNISLCEAGGELYCFDSSKSFNETTVYRFNFVFSENDIVKDEPSEFNIETLKESFNAETVNTEYSIKEKLLQGLAVVQENKIYYAINDYTGNDLIICSYDTEKNETETVSKDYYNNFEKISYDFIGIYSDSLYYRLYLGNYGSTSAADEEEYCIKKLDLSTGESETIYSCTTKPSDLLNKAVIIDNYLFFEDTAAVYNIVRYDMESGNTVIFKENASAPASHKDKLIFCRKQDGNRAIYSCDLKSGENEEKLCDLSSDYVYPSVCSDGEKIWLSVLDTSSSDTFTVGYLDENNNFNRISTLIKDYFPYEFKYASGYIVLHDMMIDVKSREIISIENVAAVGNELYCGKYRTKYNQRMKQYQTELYLYHLQKSRL